VRVSSCDERLKGTRSSGAWNNPGVPWFLWLVIVAIVLTVLFVAIGRGLQRKGRDMERHRD